MTTNHLEHERSLIAATEPRRGIPYSSVARALALAFRSHPALQELLRPGLDEENPLVPFPYCEWLGDRAIVLGKYWDPNNPNNEHLIVEFKNWLREAGLTKENA